MLPRDTEMKLPLLLELERAGGVAGLQQMTESVKVHFPNLTAADLAITNRDGRTPKWQNRLAFGRQYLVETGDIDGSVHARWRITEDGKCHLRDRLRALDASDAESFIRSQRSLGEIAEPAQWNWPERRKRPPKAGAAPRQRDVQPAAPAATPPPASPRPLSIRDELVAKLSSMNDRQFENFVGRLLSELGYHDVEVVGRSGDGGVDVRCIWKGPFIEPPLGLVAQVKRHASSIGPSVVGDLRGRWGHRADRLILINTGGFTHGAREAAAEQGAKQVSLVSGEDLAEIMIQRGIGVTREPMVVERLDEAFFEHFSS